MAKKKRVPKTHNVNKLKGIEDPVKGDFYVVPVKNNSGKRKITFKYTGKTGFGKWKITKNVAD